MLYDYECKEHGAFERISLLSECDKPVPCPVCGGKTKKIIINGHGGYQREDSEWIRSLNTVLSDSDKPINLQTKNDLKKFYAANPDIRPVESHPAFPSSYGDIEKPMSEKQYKKERSKKAQEVIRDMNAISI